MGLLDDAIRQHLDLKRRHGADATDVAKLEHEAFGPIERGAAYAAPEVDAPLPAAEALHEPAGEDPFAYAEAEEEWAAEPPLDPDPATAVLPPAAPQPAAPEPLAPAFYEPPRVAPRDPAPTAHERPRAAPQPIPPDDVGERTVEFSALHPEPDPQPDGAPGEHDELEETPEFLQETPEHDRLWFEQKPPRDFDF